MYSFKRSERVKETMQREIAAIIREEVKDPRIGFVTVTSITLAEKLNFARVFISPMGSEDEKRNSFRGIVSASKYIRSRLGKKMRLRYIPEIRFALDDSPEHADKIHKILHDIEAEQETVKED